MSNSAIKAMKEVDEFSISDDSKFIEISQTEHERASKVETKDRSKLTTNFVWGFFILLVWSFVFVFVYNWVAVWWAIDLQERGMVEAANKIALLELDKVISLIVGVLGTPLGFIIGYYFKEKKG
ncbi:MULTISPECIES: hypothetical protein [Providencia]|uniref:hypothetical protein n=1 Tax=Providencia TaxID=586 RepID=UPI0022B70F6F|nr:MULTISPECIES: hypothetical protein [Providencia]MDT2017067.1 hypothetical protein [Providencia stuartii]MDT2083216.1 hypothetical protein [Providencia stuartii]WBA57889.1 hypothetical protein O7C57_04700 [Providencia sp. 21OH12SH02B-Prov]HEM8303344.1 hypothetical protein [Providencia stuartii]